MKKLLLCIALLVLAITQANAQKNNGSQHHQIIKSTPSYELVATRDLSWIQPTGQRSTGFPWNGCGEFTITIDLIYMQVETVVVVCCVQGICIPNVQLPVQVDISDSEPLEITQSSTEVVGNHQISIRPGTYTVGEDGGIQDLTYLVRTSK